MGGPGGDRADRLLTRSSSTRPLREPLGEPLGQPLTGAPEISLALRLPVLTVVSCTLGLLAHVLAQGTVPGAGSLLFVVLAVAVLWAPMCRAELTTPRLLAGVLAVQAGVHLALTEPAGGPHGGGHGRAADHVSGLTSTGAAATMWLLHLVAALLVAGWLRRGESATWRAVRRLLPELAVAAATVPPLPRLALVPTPAPLPGWSHPLAVRTLRGPPACA